MHTFFRPVYIGLCLTVGVALSSCLKDDVSTVAVPSYSSAEYHTLSQVLDLPAERDNYQVELAMHMKRMGIQAPAIHNAKATLGRVLFYDTKLSRTNTVSCASCHHQELAFSDNKAFSEGFDGQFTRRNSLALGATPNFSSSYDGGGSFSSFAPSIGFFWDERAQNIAEQSVLTIEDDIEMGMDIHELSGKLATEPYYQVLFDKAYGDSRIDADRITLALQEFLNSFVSVRARFDAGMDATGSPFSDFPNYNQVENRGKTLFMEHCASCHGTNMTQSFTNVANNGLDLQYADQGLGARFSPDFNGVFKVPFLRNIALTAPYMHDGRFATLAEVIDHYDHGVQAHPNLDSRLRQGIQPQRLNLSEADKAAMVAFLHTLTDESFVADHRFSNPFK